MKPIARFALPVKAPFFAAVVSAFLLFHSASARAQSQDLLMGNPSNATAAPTDADNFLMVKPYFTLSYNNSQGIPNWVSWRLTAEDIGTAARVPFYPDNELPRGFLKVTPRDYSGSGFDRGHMCDHSDRSATPEASHATFTMVNMIPQSPDVNEKAWMQLESYCRLLAQKEHKHLYIIAGPAGEGGAGKNGPKTRIGRSGQIVVPAKCWKVIMVLGGGGDGDLQKVTQDVRLIAVIMPNDMTVGEQWSQFRVSVREVEKLTGYHFFGAVPAAIIEPLKDRVDAERIAPPVMVRH